MKTLVILLFIVMGQFCKPQLIKDKTLVTIYFVDYEMMTPFKITSKYFEEFFIKEADSILITDKTAVTDFIQRIRSLEISEDAPSPDIRQKIIIKDENGFEKVILYSDGEYAMLRNDSAVIFNQDLQNLINNIIFENEKQND